jgi:DNA-damage-inducible protein J
LAIKTAITVRVDEAVKEQAEKMLEDIGMNMTTYIVSSLKALVREKKVPFELVTSDYLTDKIILDKLVEAEKEALDPNTKWLSHEEVFGKMRKKHGY